MRSQASKVENRHMGLEERESRPGEGGGSSWLESKVQTGELGIHLKTTENGSGVWTSVGAAPAAGIDCACASV